MPGPNFLQSPVESPKWPSREAAALDLELLAEATCQLPEPGRPWSSHHVSSVGRLVAHLTPDARSAQRNLNRAAHIVAELADPPLRAAVMAMVAVVLDTVDAEASRLRRNAERRQRRWTDSDVRHKVSREVAAAVKHGPAAFLTDDGAGGVEFEPDQWIADTFDGILNAPVLTTRLGPAEPELVERAVAPVARWARNAGVGHVVDDLMNAATMRVAQVIDRGQHLRANNPEAFLWTCAHHAAIDEWNRCRAHHHVPLVTVPEQGAATAENSEEDRSLELLLGWIGQNAESLREDTEHVIALDGALLPGERRRIARPRKARRICELASAVSVDDAPAVAESVEVLRQLIGADRTRDQILFLHLTVYAGLMVKAPEEFPLMAEAGTDREPICAARADQAAGKAVLEWVRGVLQRRLAAAFRV